MEFQRTAAKRIRESVKNYPITAIMGPRQSGKTTLAQSLLPKATYWTLEDPDTRQFAEDDPRGFLEQSKGLMIIDEAQRVPQLFSYLQSIVDRRKKDGQFLITGSSNFLLHQAISQSLAGRVSIQRLLPLTSQELLVNKSLPSAFSALLLKGGYPVLYKKKIQSADWFGNYIQTYLEKDVRQLQRIGDLTLFQRFLKTCALRCGQLLNLSTIGNDLGISHHTVNQWITVLEASFIAFRLSPYHENIGKRLVKTTKLYFYDTGLVAYLIGLRNNSDYDQHPFKGALFENFIISEFYKHAFHKGILPEYYFWQDKTGNEIDLFIPHTNNTLLIECKAGSTFTADYLKNIKYYQKINPNRKSSGLVFYGGNKSLKNEQTEIIFWKEFPEMLNKITN